MPRIRAEEWEVVEVFGRKGIGNDSRATGGCQRISQRHVGESLKPCSFTSGIASRDQFEPP